MLDYWKVYWPLKKSGGEEMWGSDGCLCTWWWWQFCRCIFISNLTVLNTLNINTHTHTHTHTHFTCQTKINKPLANNQKMLTESEQWQDFHHPALQYNPICKHLSFLNRRASNFYLLQRVQRPPTHGTCCTVKLPLNELQLKTKFGVWATGAKDITFI